MIVADLFQFGEFVLNSGAKSSFKIEWDAASPEMVVGLASMIRQLVGPYGSVEGIPRGGTSLASVLELYVTKDAPHLIVDDVLTTGGSMERARDAYGDCDKPCVGAVVFARGRCPDWIRAVFQMPEAFWVKPPDKLKEGD